VERKYFSEGKGIIDDENALKAEETWGGSGRVEIVTTIKRRDRPKREKGRKKGTYKGGILRRSGKKMRTMSYQIARGSFSLWGQ